jgi:hypothetical protein
MKLELVAAPEVVNWWQRLYAGLAALHFSDSLKLLATVAQSRL